MKEEDLSLSEYLLMEVLASRIRLGEQCWTFPRKRAGIRRVLNSLQKYGLLEFDTDMYGEYRAFITPAGRKMFIVPHYKTPPTPTVCDF